MIAMRVLVLFIQPAQFIALDHDVMGRGVTVDQGIEFFLEALLHDVFFLNEGFIDQFK